METSKPKGHCWQWMRPHVHAPCALQVWIGGRFALPVAIQAVTADALGVGQGGGESWDGGLQLQNSQDGQSWVTVAEQPCANVCFAHHAEIEVSLCLLSARILGSIAISMGTTMIALHHAAASVASSAAVDCYGNNIRLIHGSRELKKSPQTARQAGLCNGDLLTIMVKSDSRFWRVTNLGDCGSRPAVPRLVFFDNAEQEYAVEPEELICSGWDEDHGNRDTKGP